MVAKNCALHQVSNSDCDYIYYEHKGFRRPFRSNAALMVMTDIIVTLLYYYTNTAMSIRV